MAVKLDVPKKAIADRIEPILENIVSSVSFGLGRANKEKVEHELFDSPLWRGCEAGERLKPMARDQLRTVGAGHHHLGLFQGGVGVGLICVPSRSRRAGPTTPTPFL